MINLDELTKEIEFKLKGKTYKITEPTVEQSIEFEEKFSASKGNPKKEAEEVMAYIDRLGFPHEVLVTLTNDQLLAVMGALTSSKK